MVTLVGGIIALILGLIGLVYWWQAFVIMLQAVIPVILILGGALAVYLGIEEWKDAQSMPSSSTPSSAGSSDVEKYKEEAEKYKAELEALKKSQTEGDPEVQGPAA